MCENLEFQTKKGRGNKIQTCKISIQYPALHEVQPSQQVGSNMVLWCQGGMGSPQQIESYSLSAKSYCNHQISAPFPVLDIKRFKPFSCLREWWIVLQDIGLWHLNEGRSICSGRWVAVQAIDVVRIDLCQLHTIYIVYSIITCRVGDRVSCWAINTEVTILN